VVQDAPPFVETSTRVVVVPTAAAHERVTVALPVTAAKFETEHGSGTTGFDPVREHVAAGGATIPTTDEPPAPTVVSAVTLNR
jgi:hypothetical protein